MSRSLQVACLVNAGLLLTALPVAAQVRAGELSTDLSGTLATGYSATYGNMTASTHDTTIGGAATLSGSYYNPNFLSFNVSGYLNQSSSNSNFQSITDSSGIDLSTTLFGGSHFPGSINYSKAYNSEGNYSVPGVANYVTHGDSGTFGINWSENIPGKPNLSAGYQMGNSEYSVYGTSDDGTNAFNSLNLHSSYSLAGFNMSAYYTTGNSHSRIPQVISGALATEIHSNNDAYGFNAAHQLPMHGSVSAGINHTSWDSNYLGTRSRGTIDMVNSLASVHPTEKMSLSVTADYSDNLTGQLYQSVIAAGGVVPGLNSNESSNSLDIMGVASYTPMPNLQTSAIAEYRTQYYMGQTYGLQSYGGSASYSRALLDGSFNASVNATDNLADNSGNNSLSFSTTENYTTQYRGWHTTGSFGYSQNVQTLLVTYMNSFYHYSVNTRRNWGKFNVSAGAGGARTALTQEAGTANSSQTYNASLAYGSLLMATGSYSKASGQALATGSGLVPVPPPGLPSDLVYLFDGDSYSFGLSSSPIRHLTLAAAYAKSSSNTTGQTGESANHNKQFNTLIQYQVRKLNFISGYTRLEQGFSTTGTQPEIVSSFYVGLSRWFNFF